MFSGMGNNANMGASADDFSIYVMLYNFLLCYKNVQAFRFKCLSHLMIEADCQDTLSFQVIATVCSLLLSAPQGSLVCIWEKQLRRIHIFFSQLLCGHKVDSLHIW